ncbi:Ger(x)C family spore germination protein [Fictibacillus fluitans]|uniref:Ger(X)C family spore germination protein n=1 Tax=Fictibacillus fluitans TaxID=3058422 RepID=A0ABT8HSR9_9BACL|nr:Ger(x)C family spore germination protein [Fictibacillus sp. NE201]MDN4523822.1 Ger(x)C family spore germination protein [Fictibacillus sp. NE201]
MKKSISLLLVIVCLLLFTGCNGRRELNELLIVSSLGIDLAKNGETEVHLQVVNPGGMAGNQGGAPSGGSGGAVYTYSIKGATVYEAIQKAGQIVPRYLMFSHINSLVIGEDFARKKGIRPIFDFVERNHEFRETVPMFIAKDSMAKDILTLFTPIFKNPGESLNNRLDLSALSTGLSEGVQEKEVVRWEFGEKRDPAIPGVKVFHKSPKGDETSILDGIKANNKTFIITGTALFKKDKLVGWMNGGESKGWAMITGKTNELSIFTKTCGKKKGHLGFVAKEINTKVKPVIKGDHISFDVHVTGKGYLQEVTCNVNVGDPMELKKMEGYISKVVEDEINQAVQKAQAKKADVFGFGRLLNENHPEIWKVKEDQWKQEFAKVKVRPIAKITLVTTGARIETVNQQKK